MLSIDGLRADYVDDATLHLPALRGLMARGARATRMAPIFPTVTWPCHTSIVTGVSPARHGILGNLVFDRASGRPVEHYGDRTGAPVLAPTLWDRLHARGERTAGVCWPKTRGVAAVADNIPEFYEQELFEEYASRPLWTELATKGLPVHRYGPWSKQHPLGPMQDWLSLESARHVLAVRPPRLLLLHFLTLDSFQHDHGIGQPRGALGARADGRAPRSPARLPRRAGSARDHDPDGLRRSRLRGGRRRRHHLNQLLREESFSRWTAAAQITRRLAWAAGNGGAAHVYALDGAPRTTVDRLRGALRRPARRRRARPRALRRAGPARARPRLDAGRPRCSPADDGVFFTGHPTPEAAAAARRSTGPPTATRPSLPQLGAAFVMAGPGVREGAHSRRGLDARPRPRPPRASSAWTCPAPRALPLVERARRAGGERREGHRDRGGPGPAPHAADRRRARSATRPSAAAASSTGAWTPSATRAAGDIVFVGGYRIDRVQADYPRLRFVHNADWERNNILASLFSAERRDDGRLRLELRRHPLHAGGGCAVSCASPADIALLVDTDWRERYRPRTQHPESDGEKVRLQGGRVTEVSRAHPARRGARRVHRRGQVQRGRGPRSSSRTTTARAPRVRRAALPRRVRASGAAYLIDLLQAMLEAGVEMHAVETPGGYFEIDTTRGPRAGLARAGTRSRRRAARGRDAACPASPRRWSGACRARDFVRDLLDRPETTRRGPR